jgi:pyroglutamyl-peptidase
MAKTILLTGFGPFPGAPFNPTGALVARLARLKRPALAGTRRIAHVFPTSYAAVDRELPDLIAQHHPQVILMFGLASRTRHIRIETRARNRISALIADAEGSRHRTMVIEAGGKSALPFSPLSQRLLMAARRRGVPSALSCDAGRYLCNYLCWRTLEAAAKSGGPAVVAFVHVPKVGRVPGPRARSRAQPVSFDDLVRVGEALLLTMIGAAQTSR